MSDGKNMNKNEHVPLAERCRPMDLEEFIGQEHLVSSNKIIIIPFKNIYNLNRFNRCAFNIKIKIYNQIQISFFKNLTIS